jgi:tight junction protein 1
LLVAFVIREVERILGQVMVTLLCTCRAAHKSSKKLFEQCQKLEKVWGHTFSCSITLTSPESWYRKVRELIDKQQSAPVWMSESKVRPLLVMGTSCPVR